MMKKYIQGFISAIIFFVFAIIAEFLLLSFVGAIFNKQLMPRGLGWIVFPILAAILGWQIGTSFDASLLKRKFEHFGSGREKKNTQNNQQPLKRWVAASLTWVIAALFFFVTVNPFGNWWSDSEWFSFWAWLVGPPLIGFIALKLFKWANNKSDL